MVLCAFLWEDCVVGDTFRDGDSLGCVSERYTRQAKPTTAKPRPMVTWML